MLIQPFLNVIESAIANHEWRGASGYVADIDTLTSDEAMRKLDEAHRGCFVYLAFDGRIDTLVTEYVASGALAADSGLDILVLFTTQEAVSTPRSLTATSLKGIALVDDARHPAYDYIRFLVPEATHPPVPCAVIFRHFSDMGEPIIVPLGDAASAAELRRRLQTIFSVMTAHISTLDGGRFAEEVSAAFAWRKIEYIHGRRTSVREWLAMLLQWARQNLSTVVSILKLIG